MSLLRSTTLVMVGHRSWFPQDIVGSPAAGKPNEPAWGRSGIRPGSGRDPAGIRLDRWPGGRHDRATRCVVRTLARCPDQTARPNGMTVAAAIRTLVPALSSILALALPAAP